ncbi:hypothetical protein VTL71DRAFT_5282 [Oculimacula yallundae]|uniref:Uncharacterized protein n=1 Tax=Oculimacula yallundae TaxID=86028 RepID=A0ABR4C198_9HELO
MARSAKSKSVWSTKPQEVEAFCAARDAASLQDLKNAVANTVLEKPTSSTNPTDTTVDIIAAKPAEPVHWDLYSDPIIKTEEDLMKERVEEELKGWPWKECPQKLFTSGPFALNYSADGGQNTSPRFKLPQAKQISSLLLNKLFATDDIARTLLPIIFKHHSSAWRFWSTCQEVMVRYDHQIDLWDMTGTLEQGGYFRNCEKDRYGPNAPTDPYDQGAVSPIVVIAPFRRPSGPPSYFEQVRNLHTMSIAMSNFADNMQNLQIHRIHFLTPQLLNLLIPKMTNLKVLGIYQCQLLPVTEIFRLLDIIKTDRPLGRENQISLDFYPTWH